MSFDFDEYSWYHVFMGILAIFIVGLLIFFGCAIFCTHTVNYYYIGASTPGTPVYCVKAQKTAAGRLAQLSTRKEAF